MGIIGAWLVELLCHWGDDRPSAFLSADEAKAARSMRKRNLRVIVINLVITFALSAVPMVDWAAHFGGWCVRSVCFRFDVHVVISGHLLPMHRVPTTHTRL
jgi:membrane associated rhomboid family serine protease